MRKSASSQNLGSSGKGNPYDEVAAQLEKNLVVSDLTSEDYARLDPADLFDEEPVDLETFLYDGNYLGNVPRLSDIQFDFLNKATTIYQTPTLETLGWEVPIPYKNVGVAMWGKGSGKDTVARLILSRIAYLLLVLKSPQKYYDKAPWDDINTLNVALSAKQAQNIFFEPLKKMLDMAPWFKKRGFEGLEEVIKFPKQINLHSGHSDQESLEGHNLMASVLDEIAAFKTNIELRKRQRASLRPLQHSADAIYEMLRSSSVSRFPRVFKLILISYPRFKGDYITLSYTKGLTNPTWFVSKAATWEANPTIKETDFAQEFAENPEGSAAKYKCDPPAAVDAYFKKLTPETIAMVFPKRIPEDLPLDENYKLRPDFKGISGVNYYGHIDLGLSHDSAGVCICHRSGWDVTVLTSTDEIGLESSVEVRIPRIKVDLWTSFVAAPASEIDLSEIRQLLFDMQDYHNFHLQKITFDKFQSADSIQQLQKKGIEADIQSVDKDTAAYDTLKDYIYMHRLEAYHREVGIEELRGLVLINATKIDHIQGASKDESDALAGAVKNAVDAEESDVTIDDFGVAGPYNEQLQTAVTDGFQLRKDIQTIWDAMNRPKLF